MTERYDSYSETKRHISRVYELLDQCASTIVKRGIKHDSSKLCDPERSIFDEMTPKLKASTYGSPEYKDMLEEMKPALVHHYANNRHHPEHFDNGINDMTLIDIVEMLCDWKAATERHADGDISRSIEVNTDRFEMSDQLASIFKNTVKELGW